MIKRNVWPFLVPVAILAILLIGFYDQLGEFNEALPSPLIGEPVPAFHLTALADAQKEVTEQSLQGQITLLNVFASWCTTCEREHPFLMSVANQPSDFVMIGLNYKDDRKAAQQWLANRGNPYRWIIYDPAGTLGLDLGVYGVPETYLIDKAGIIRMKWVGKITPKLWNKQVLPAIRKLHQGEDLS